MSSEWLKVMLDEIARKKREAAEALIEEERRALQRTNAVLESERDTLEPGEPGGRRTRA